MNSPTPVTLLEHQTAVLRSAEDAYPLAQAADTQRAGNVPDELVLMP